MKVKIVKEVKRSDGLWRFACGDVFKWVFNLHVGEDAKSHWLHLFVFSLLWALNVPKYCLYRTVNLSNAPSNRLPERFQYHIGCSFDLIFLSKVGHLRTLRHTGEKLNKCKKCYYISAQISNYRTHIKTQSGESFGSFLL